MLGFGEGNTPYPATCKLMCLSISYFNTITDTGRVLLIKACKSLEAIDMKIPVFPIHAP
jgi:hypothetical protein